MGMRAMTRILLAFAALVFSLALNDETFAAEKRVALVIGNGAYKAPLELVNPPEDARAVAQSLSRLGFEVIQGYDLKGTEMTAKLKDFARAVQGADAALFFYAGHGMQVAGENYLIPVDAVLKSEADLDFDAVKLDTVMRQLLREAKVKIVILDACRDNPLAAQLSRSMGAARSRSLNPSAGMAPVDAQNASGTLIAFATAPGTVASDGSSGHSPFTAALLSHLETPNLDIDAMMKRVRGEVSKITGEHQQPWTNSSLTSEFFMKSAPAPAPETAAAAPAQKPAAPAPAVQTPAVQTASIDPPAASPPSRNLNIAGSVTDELRAQRADKASESALALSRDQIKDVNVRLILLGHNAGGTGNTLTPGSRKALSAFQTAAGLVPSGYLNRGQFELLKARSDPQFTAWVQQGKPALASVEAQAETPQADTPRRAAKPERVERAERAERPERGRASSGPDSGASARSTGEFLGGVARGLSRGRIGF